MHAHYHPLPTTSARFASYTWPLPQYSFRQTNSPTEQADR